MLNTSVNRAPLTRSARLAAVIALLALTISIAGFGAQRFFTVSGTVVDSTNRFVPDTTLVVTNATSQAKHEIKSDPTGHFEFVGLPPGEYAFEGRKPGFSTYKDTFVVVGRDIDRAVELRVGSLEETVTVVGSSSEPAGQQEARRQELARERIDELKRRAEARCEGAVSTVGGSIIPPVKLVSVNPQYPENLRTARVGGVVTADVVIGIDGHVQDILNVKSPYQELEAAAVEAVRQWQFSQTLLNCTPTEVPMTVTIRFSAQP
ncbi:MAG TPA: TonB family protein [Vicinamibacterales bacterium]|nr:TonB family protein [Vicinamibacterales bacterium]